MRDTQPSDKAVKHEKVFKPASAYDAKYVSYEHKPELAHKKPEAKKDDDGKVLTGPKNFYTRPCKPTLGQMPPHMKEEYERLKKIKSEEWKKSKAKMQEKIFNPMSHGDKPFFDDKKTYEIDKNLKQRPQTSKEAPALHEHAFKPSNPPRVGYNKTINPFPKYSELGPKPRSATFCKKPEEGKEEKKKWRETHNNNISRHDPSIVTNFKNLKSEFKSMFK